MVMLMEIHFAIQQATDTYNQYGDSYQYYQQKYVLFLFLIGNLKNNHYQLVDWRENAAQIRQMGNR